MSVNTERMENETFEDYMVRLFDAQRNHQLTCQQVADLLNVYADVKKSETTYRRYYEGFADGRVYENRMLCGECEERILCLGDLHVPFQLPVETFRRYYGRVDTLVLPGDLMDMHSISKFQKTYRISPVEEMILCRDYLLDLIRCVMPKKVIAMYGNHEIRFQNYLSNMLDTDIKDLLPKTPLDLILDDGFSRYDEETGTRVFYEPIRNLADDVTVINAHNWWYQYGSTIFCHPLTFKSGMLKTAEDALLWFRNEGLTFKNLVVAHTHRIGFYVLGNSMIFETGCCCDISKMNYIDGKLVYSQKEGFLSLSYDKNGDICSYKQEILN